MTSKPWHAGNRVDSNPAGSLKVGDVGAWILPLGRGALLTWPTQVDEAKHVLLGREAHGGTALWSA